MAHTPRNTLVAQVGSNVDEKHIQSVFKSLKDRIYQRSFNLRKTFRELDADGKGYIPIDHFVGEMTRSYSLSPLEQRCLAVLLEDADFHRDGLIDFREFCEMLKMRDHQGDPTVSEGQKKHLQGRGVMDPRMQKMLSNPDAHIRVEGGLPTNELGAMTIECPYGVLGDSERMDAVIATFFQHKMDTLRTVFRAHDDDHDGWLTHAQFRAGIKEVDKYVFDDEVDQLIDVLKNGPRKHLVNIEDFVNGLGREYLKKKAHRSAAYANPFVWQDKPLTSSRKTKPVNLSLLKPPQAITTETAPSCSPRGKLKPGITRGQQLRLSQNKAKMADMAERRKEDKYYEQAAAMRKAGVPILPEIGTPRRN